MKRTGAVRFAAWVLAVACLLLFGTYALTSGVTDDHDCSGGSCILCLCCRLREASVSLAAVVAAVTSLGLLLPLVCSRVPAEPRCPVADGNLVRLKVKLSN